MKKKDLLKRIGLTTVALGLMTMSYSCAPKYLTIKQLNNPGQNVPVSSVNEKYTDNKTRLLASETAREVKVLEGLEGQTFDNYAGFETQLQDGSAKLKTKQKIFYTTGSVIWDLGKAIGIGAAIDGGSSGRGAAECIGEGGKIGYELPVTITP